MKKLAKPALENVINNNIKFHPENIKKTYKHWMENIKDWCISRQLWWGHRLPVWYCNNKNSSEKKCNSPIISKEKLIKCPYCKQKSINQDKDVLDTWFSSWLWPISVFDGIRNPDNNEIKYYYPTNDLVTAPEILFFWVARMIIAGYEYKNNLPFKNVYFTGIVRDKQRRKMSKSLGNSPDPIKLMNKYGADGVRVGILLSSPAGNDLLFNKSLCEQGRNFSNKIWNSFRLINSWTIEKRKQKKHEKIATNWFKSKLNATIKDLNISYKKYKISEALMTNYRLFWDDFCSWYLEIIKPKFGNTIDTETYNLTISFIDTLLKLLHPFMPFITEEIWHLIQKREKCITISSWPKEEKFNQEIINEFEVTTELITAIRNIRKEKNIPNKTPINLNINKRSVNEEYDSIINKLCNIKSSSIVTKKPKNAFSFRIKTGEYYIPLSDNINIKDEIKKLKKELDYIEGFLKSVDNKLNNKSFITNAPKNVIELEQKKQLDAKEKLNLIKNQLSSLY